MIMLRMTVLVDDRGHNDDVHDDNYDSNNGSRDNNENCIVVVLMIMRIHIMNIIILTMTLHDDNNLHWSKIINEKWLHCPRSAAADPL